MSKMYQHRGLVPVPGSHLLRCMTGKLKYLWGLRCGNNRLFKRGEFDDLGGDALGRTPIEDLHRPSVPPGRPILILDQFTSALDAETERTVRASLRDLRKGKTTLVVSHHPKVLADADRVILLEKGRITAEGSYRELAGQGLITELTTRDAE